VLTLRAHRDVMCFVGNIMEETPGVSMIEFPHRRMSTADMLKMDFSTNFLMMT
jgi:hypothetical protein